MLAATHALTGALIATQISHPAAAVGLAFISHPLLDLFPHWDFNSRWAKRSRWHTFALSALDSGSGLLLGILLFATPENWLYLLTVMVVAQWADFLEAPYHFGFENNRFFKWIKHLQHLWHTKAPWPWGFLPQVGIASYVIWTRVQPLLISAGN